MGEQPVRNIIGNTNKLGKCKAYTEFDETDPTTCSGDLNGDSCVNRRPTAEQLGGKRWQWHEKPGSGKKFCGRTSKPDIQPSCAVGRGGQG
jgi:hypothetical protein